MAAHAQPNSEPTVSRRFTMPERSHTPQSPSLGSLTHSASQASLKEAQRQSISSDVGTNNTTLNNGDGNIALEDLVISTSFDDAVLKHLCDIDVSSLSL